jgi:hypothetical protein
LLPGKKRSAFLSMALLKLLEPFELAIHQDLKLVLYLLPDVAIDP